MTACSLEPTHDSLAEWSNAVIAMSAGLLFGLITMLVQYVGLFMLGFHTGEHKVPIDTID